MVKAGIALAFALIAALAVMAGGLSSELEIEVILPRMAVGFCAAGLIVYIVAAVLRQKEISDFEKFMAAYKIGLAEDSAEKEATETDAAQDSESEKEASEGENAQEETQGEGDEKT